MAATHTTRLNLNMPNESDFVNVITDINENMQSIDDAFGMIGSQYDPTATYKKDDYCMHDAKFYRALQDIDTPEEWDATHWTESNIIDEITGTAHSASTLRDIPIMIATTDWTLTGGKYVAEFDTAYITETSKDFVIFDESYKMFAQADMVADKKTGGGGMVFKTAVQPIGYIYGTIYTVDANDGKVPVLLEDTVTPIANGGTGQNTLASAKQAFGITALEEDVTTLQNDVTTLNGNLESINGKITYESIINMQQITTSYVTRDTFNGRKFSDYGLLVFTPVVNSWARVSCIVPTWIFENYTGVDIRFYQGSNLIEVDVKRTSDTTFDAKYIGTLDTGCYVNCFGVFKLT